MKAAERLWLTADGERLVPDGHKDAAFLYAAKGDEIPASAVDKFGLVEGTVGKKEKTPAGNKEKAPAGNKEKAPAGTEGKPGEGTQGEKG